MSKTSTSGLLAILVRVPFRFDQSCLADLIHQHRTTWDDVVFDLLPFITEPATAPVHWRALMMDYQILSAGSNHSFLKIMRELRKLIVCLCAAHQEHMPASKLLPSFIHIHGHDLAVFCYATSEPEKSR